jgi:hypothetical protein
MRIPKRVAIVGVVSVALVAMVAAAFVAFAGGTHAAAGGPKPIDDSQMSARFKVEAGATVLPTTRTVAHWFGQTTNPHDGVTYGYNMVGADPNHCTGSACDVTIEVDITPIIVNVAGATYSGNDVLAATLASPQFATNDYGSTPFATNVSGGKGAGGALSQADAGVPLQLQDATMRAQFNKTGGSPYHVRLHPNLKPAVTFNVPQNLGTLLISGRGVVFGDVDIGWWSSQIHNLETSADPTHLPLYLTNSVMLYDGNNPLNCCIIGYHGTKATGSGNGSANSNGNAAVQTFAWASYIQPGIFRNATTGWALQDIHAVSHEIAEWGDDPFVNNLVEPWLTPTAPQYGCTGILETGDPVVGIGFAKGTNTYAQGPAPNGQIVADGYYHPEDEVFLPWFMRLPSNATGSEPNQISAGGRYTLMGDLNPYPGFRAPATGC